MDHVAPHSVLVVLIFANRLRCGRSKGRDYRIGRTVLDHFWLVVYAISALRQGFGIVLATRVYFELA